MFLVPLVIIPAPVALPTITLYADNTTPLMGNNVNFSWTVSSGPDNADIYEDGFLTGSGVSSPFPIGFSDTSTHPVYAVLNNGGAVSDTIYITAIPAPSSIFLDGDGSSYNVGDSFYPTWTVDGGDDYADVYVNGSYQGSGNSGTVQITPLKGSSSIYVVATTGSNPTSNTITVYANYPSISIYSPSDGTAFNDGDSFTVYWSGGMGTGNAYINGTYVGETTSGSNLGVSYGYEGISSGQYFTLEVVDDSGATGSINLYAN